MNLDFLIMENKILDKAIVDKKENLDMAILEFNKTWKNKKGEYIEITRQQIFDILDKYNITSEELRHYGKGQEQIEERMFYVGKYGWGEKD